jgi:glycosyltransferase involved in cell wall biosynthesis
MMPLLVRRWRCPDAHAIIAPRGELSEAALNLKKWKKLPFLRLVRLSGVLRGITWQASSQGEADDISLRIGSSAKVVIAPNLQRELRAQRAPQPKRSGLLRAIFISRISPKKNLPFLLEVLMTVRGRVDLDIIGPTEDANYWRRCLAEIERLPSNVAVTYRGEMAHDLVAEQLASHDLLVLPTLNENFGHVILEALSVGTPVLISDRTPWRGLASTYAGWDLDLARPQDFRAALEQCIAMDDSEFGKMSAAARERARLWTRTSKAVEANRQLFVGDQVDGRLGPGGTGDGSAPTRSETRGAQLLRTTTAGSGRRGESHVSRSASQEVD